MTGPTASFSVSVALPGASALPSLLNLSAPASVAGAPPTLAAFVDLMVDQPQVAPQPVTLADERQLDAVPGKDLPDDKEDETVDPALAWLVATPVTPASTSVAKAPVAATEIPVAKPVTDGDAKAPPVLLRPVDPRVAPQPEIKTPQPGTAEIKIGVAATAEIGIAAPAAADPTPTVTVNAVNAVAAVETPLPAASIAGAETPPVDAPVRKAGTRTDSAPAPQIQVTTRTIAAAMLRTPQAQPPVTLARSLAANAGAQPALFALAMERSSSDDTEPKPLSAQTSAAALLSPTDAAALIAKPGEVQRQALDMGRQDWPQKMIDRIETLRDDANANDTSIRLKPEALGRVDVSLKTHADGAVSVRFTAEQPATRSLLADATPQLNAAAEARGIRLAQTSVDLAGSGQGGERQRQQFELQQNLSNRLAPSGEADTNAVVDGRIA